MNEDGSKLYLNGTNNRRKNPLPVVTKENGKLTENYMHMKLSALPAAFGLPKSSKKGYFPHLFTSLENDSYVGSYPDTKYYGVDSISVKDRSKFLEWYETTRGQVFDTKKEMVEYCRMDVEIIRRACLAFRKIMVEIGRAMREVYKNTQTKNNRM